MGFGPSPLILRSCHIPRLSYLAQPGVGPVEEHSFLLGPDDLQIKLAFSGPEDGVWFFQLFVELSEARKNFPYEFSVHVIGEFSVTPEFPEEQVEPMVHINAPSVLFSVAREALASATGRSPYPSVLLPTIRFTLEESAKADQPLAASKRAGEGTPPKKKEARSRKKKTE